MFGMWKFVLEVVPEEVPETTLTTELLNEERTQEEVLQELDTQKTAAETLNFVSGSVSEFVGGSGAPLAAAQETPETPDVQEPQEVQVQVSTRTLPGQNMLTMDLGEGEVTGEVGAIVQGYGEALDRLTKELIRMMRSEKLLVVWLFDESESMKDDQEELRLRIGRVYKELQLVEKDDRTIGRTAKLDDVMIGTVLSFGSKVREIMPRPSGDPRVLRTAIERIPVDPSGDEKLCAALMEAIPKYRLMADRSDRKLVFVIISDESGDDGELIEDTVQMAKSARASIYVLGRESVFGSLYAHVTWKQPVTGRTYYLPIRRGPETPFAEQLQYDGYRRRRDSQMSGFGPYEQVRLCRDTGGIFFQLPGEQENLNDLDTRKNDALAMREYLPSLQPRREYVADVEASPFRRAIREVIVILNPYNKDAQQFLELPDPGRNGEQFTTKPGQYLPKVKKRIEQILQIAALLGRAQASLDRVRDLRPREPSLRWRANFDLMDAQLAWYRLRLFEYALGLDQFVKTELPKRLQAKPDQTHWRIRESSDGKLIMPDAVQAKMLGVSAEDLQAAHDRAVAGLQQVIDDHPGSPWARRAEWELKRRFGLSINTWKYTPSPPRPNRGPRPKPPPVPKL